MTKIYEDKKPLGDEGENRAIEYINSFSDWEAIYKAPSTIDFPYYDIVAINKSTGDIKKIEVKTDTFDNDNVAIEFKQNGLPSGLEKTLADKYFIYKKSHGRIYSINVYELKRIISEGKCDKVKCNNGTSDCYIVDLKYFKKQTQ